MYRAVTDLQMLRQIWNNLTAVFWGYTVSFLEAPCTYAAYLFSCLKITHQLTLPAYCEAAHMPWLSGLSVSSA